MSSCASFWRHITRTSGLVHNSTHVHTSSWRHRRFSILRVRACVKERFQQRSNHSSVTCWSMLCAYEWEILYLLWLTWERRIIFRLGLSVFSFSFYFCGYRNVRDKRFSPNKRPLSFFHLKLQRNKGEMYNFMKWITNLTEKNKIKIFFQKRPWRRIRYL